MEHDCGEKYTPRIHVWQPRVPFPRVCPRCKTYLKPSDVEKKPEAKAEAGAGDGS
jgi:hypothetical protein